MGKRLDCPETPGERRTFEAGFYVSVLAVVAMVAAPFIVFSDGFEISPYLDTSGEKLFGVLAAECFLASALLLGINKMADGHYRE